MIEEQKNKLVEMTKGLIGKPYKYGADPTEAPDCFDCSSFTQYVFKQIGIDLPRSAILQAADQKGKEIIPEPGFSNLEIGDLLFIRSDRGFYYDELFQDRKIMIGHAMIYLDDDKVIHSRKNKNGVVIEGLNELIKEPNYTIILVKRF
ncbi:MAG: C40 family peptidase [Patescibacteria group bacterium]|nr:C40 family peptidase [Patescibacteria group bacterium]